jgi:hypothetical protein
MAFPIQTGGLASQFNVRMPINKSELIIALEDDIKLVNECLTAYVEFKRISVQFIFDRFAADIGNDAIGGLAGDQDANLET